MLTRKEIFGSNIELHLMLEQFIYGKLTQQQLAEVRKQFSERLHKHPQQFHDLVASVRKSCAPAEKDAGDNEPLNLYKVQDVCQQIELDHINRQLDNLCEQSAVQDEDLQTKTITLQHQVASSTRDLMVDVEEAQALVIPDQNEVRVQEGSQYMQKEREGAQKLLEHETNLMSIKFEPHMEYLQKSIVLTENQIVHKMGPENDQEQIKHSKAKAGSREAVKKQIKDLRDRIRGTQDQMNKLIAQQQQDLKELTDLETQLRAK